MCSTAAFSFLFAIQELTKVNSELLLKPSQQTRSPLPQNNTPLCSWANTAPSRKSIICRFMLALQQLDCYIQQLDNVFPYILG